MQALKSVPMTTAALTADVLPPLLPQAASCSISCSDAMPMGSGAELPASCLLQPIHAASGSQADSAPQQGRQQWAMPDTPPVRGLPARVQGMERRQPRLVRAAALCVLSGSYGVGAACQIAAARLVDAAIGELPFYLPSALCQPVTRQLRHCTVCQVPTRCQPSAVPTNCSPAGAGLHCAGGGADAALAASPAPVPGHLPLRRGHAGGCCYDPRAYAWPGW